MHLAHSLLTKVAGGIPVLLSYVASSALWFFYMHQCDRGRAEMLDALTTPEA